jgi:hypothetical protein
MEHQNRYLVEGYEGASPRAHRMRYRLRALMILLAVGPPVLAGAGYFAYWSIVYLPWWLRR